MAPDLHVCAFAQVSGVLTSRASLELGIAVRSCRSWPERRCRDAGSEGDVPSPEDL